MIGKLALFVLAAMATTTLAFADPINGTQQRISPALRQISNYRDLSAWMIGQPDRLWLMMDSSGVIVLGVGDRCTFAGTPRVIFDADRSYCHTSGTTAVHLHRQCMQASRMQALSPWGRETGNGVFVVIATIRSEPRF